jgi:hypothetical protein
LARTACTLAVLFAGLAVGLGAQSATVPRLSFAAGKVLGGELPGSGDAETVAAADLNGDDRSDLVLGSFQDEAVWVALSTPHDGLVAQPTEYPVAGGPAAFATGDLNGDDSKDVVIAGGTGAKTVSVLLNRGDGSFQQHVDYATAASPQGVAVADLDGDGKPDVVTADSAARVVSVLLNRGDGTLAPRTDFRTGALPTGVAIGDLNGDGKPDLVTANGGAASISVLLNRGGGSFAPRTDIAVGSPANSVALADFDGDGKLDVATASPRRRHRHDVSVLLGRGDGGFRPRRDYAVSVYASRIVAGDLNGDGRPDLAVSDSGALAVFLNRGSAFDSRLWYGLSDTTAAGDFNADGRLDLAGAWVNDRNGDWNVTVHLNRPGLCAVQDVRRLTLAAAGQLLARADCRVGKVRRASSRTVAKGRVVSQRPRFPGVLAGGGRVALVLSLGRRGR